MRITLLGFVANVFGLLTFVLIVYAALAVFSLTTVLTEGMAQPPTSSPLFALLGQSLLVSGRNALAGIWDLRAGFVAFGLFGVLAAWSHHLGQLMSPKRAWWISFICVSLFLIILSITWLFAQRPQIALWLAESPEIFRWRDLLLSSHTVELTVGPIFALTLAYPVWALWRWWYTRLLALWPLRAATHPGSGEASIGEISDSSGAQYSSYADRLHALKRGALVSGSSLPVTGQDTSHTRLLENTRIYLFLGLATLLCTTLYLWSNAYHERTALRLEHGETFVDVTTQANATFPLHIDTDVHGLRVVNIKGLGVVRIFLSPADEPADPVAIVPDWAFEWRSDDYLYQDVPVAGLAPGDYLLQFEQESGWGYFEYVLSHGGGPTANFTALTTGFFLACSLLLIIALLTLISARIWVALQ